MATNLGHETGTLVTQEALPRLQNLLEPMVPSWDLFAQQIGVSFVTVTQIEAANAHKSPNWLSTCLSKALQEWVAYHPSPTYEVIIAVLDPKEGMTPVMNRALARKVREFMAREQESYGGQSSSGASDSSGGAGGSYSTEPVA